MSTNPTPAAALSQDRRFRALASGEQTAGKWAIAAAFGAIAISLAPQQPAVRLVLPVAVMVFYAYMSYPRTNAVALRTVRLAQLADSVYFLGFLWTLWALIDAFVLHSAAEDAAFRVFGFALVTTAAGMGIRLYLLQFKYGAADQAEQADLTIERNVERLSAATERVCVSLQKLHSQTDVLHAQLSQFSEASKEAHQGFAQAHRETSTKITETIAETVADVREALKRPVQEYGKSIRAFTGGVNEQARALEQTVAAVSKTVTQSVEEAANTMKSAIGTTAGSIAADHIRIAHDLQAQVAQISTTLSRISEGLAGIGQFGTVLSKLGGIVSELDRCVAAFSGTIGPNAELTINLQNLPSRLETSLSRAQAAMDELTKKLGQVRVPSELSVELKDISSAMKALEESAENLLKRSADPRWQHAPQAASDALLKLTASVNTVRDSLNGLSGAAKDKGGWIDRLMGR